MRLSARIVIVAHLVLMTGVVIRADDIPPHTGPWDLARLFEVPEYRWGKSDGLVTEVFYEGLPRDGKPTTVYAVVARPTGASSTHPAPGVVLVHGGGGTAFPDWATLWAQRGYVAIAMDLRGQGPDGERLEDGAPDFDALFHEILFHEIAADGSSALADGSNAESFWSYHAIADVVLAHSLLRSLPEVDATRTAITGVSWGGYTTSLVAGLDMRFKAAVPIYGCGNLHVNSAWTSDLAGLDDEHRQRWVRWFDPISYLPQVRCPTLWINGTNDFAYFLDSYQASYRSIPQAPGSQNIVSLGVKVGRPHGHRVAWAVPEQYVYIDHILRDGKPLPHVEPLTRSDSTISAEYTSPAPIVEAGLHYTTDTGRWPERTWHSMPATISVNTTGGNTVTATLPETRPIVAFLSVTDERGLYASSDHVSLEE